MTGDHHAIHPAISTIDIAASPDRVWQVLTDFPSWSGWNPFIRHIEGNLTPGSRLVTRMYPAGDKPRTFRPVVEACVPGESFAWRGRLAIPGLFDGHHQFRLTPIASGTRLVHQEQFTGLLLLVVDVERFRADFIAMNNALKAQAEAT
ncbi:MAG: SRPBCC domain-containing protein [Rhodobacterales bacterium]|nr:SRPBCC domain-containing protein [Rhodobacterales bacterium]